MDTLKRDFVRLVWSKLKELGGTVLPGQSEIIMPGALTPEYYMKHMTDLEHVFRVQTPTGPRYFSVKITERL